MISCKEQMLNKYLMVLRRKQNEIKIRNYRDVTLNVLLEFNFVKYFKKNFGLGL
jgi:hypothetical protein